MCPACAVLVTAGPDEVRVPGPIKETDCGALTAPRGVPAAVPLDHHNSRLPLHLVVAEVVRRLQLPSVQVAAMAL